MHETNFTKLQIWSRSMDLVETIYQITKLFPKEELFCLVSQMRRCSISVASNIAEGSQRVSAKEFAHFLQIAKGSLAELETQVLLAIRVGYLAKEKNEDLLNEIREISRMLYAFRSSLKDRS